MEYNNHTPYRDILASRTKEELFELRDFFNVQVAKNRRKDIVIEAIMHLLKFEPVSMLARLPEYELRYLRQLASKGKGKRIALPSTDFVFFTELFYMTVVEEMEDEHHGNLIVLSFVDDIYDLWAPYVDEAYALKEKSGAIDVEDFFWGCLTMYGALTKDEFLDILIRHYKDKVLHYMYVLNREAFIDYCAISDYYVHPALDAELIDLLKERKSRNFFSKPPSELPVEDILEAGKTVPWSVANINHTEAQILQRQLVRAGYSPEQLPGMLYDIWLEKVHPDKDGGGMGEATGQIMQEAHFKNLQEANLLLGAITAYSNSIPTWLFKGRSSDEMYGKDPKRGEKLATASAMVSQMSRGYQQASAFPKVGRNDPCPCGSGLKYKNCHGKNLS